MRLHLTFDIEVDPDGLERYRAEYPDFERETPIETLSREAIAAWEWDGLIAGGALVESGEQGELSL